MAKKRLEVVIAGDARGANRAFDSVERRGSGFASKMGGVGKKVAAGMAVGLGAGAVALGGFVAGGLKSLTNIEKLNAQTAQVVKTTGGAARVSASDVEAYASAIEKKTGIEAESIQSGQNLLLTFTNVQNKVGKGNDIFNQATSIMTDMSVALGTDTKTSAIQLGKALNDPVKGVSALSKVGVSFTKQQKDQIKALQASGDTMGAQKIILAELNKEFGGSAKAFGSTTEGKIAKLKNTFGDLQEALAAKLLPVAVKVVDWAGVFLPQAGAKAAQLFQKLQPQIHQVGEVIARLGVVGMELVAAVQTAWPQVQMVISNVVRTVQVIVSGVVDVLLTLWQNFGNNIITFTQSAWHPIRQIISGVLLVIRGVIKTIVSLIHGDWAGAWAGIKQIVSGVWNAILGEVKFLIAELKLVIGIALEILGSMFKRVWHGIQGTVSGAVGGIVSAVGSIPGRLLALGGSMLSAGAHLGSSILKGLKSGLSAITGFAGDVGSAVWRAVKGQINNLIDGMNDSIPNSLGKGPFKIDLPDNPIPRIHHTGGVFRAPTPGGEGFALLRDGERVLTPTSNRDRAVSVAGGRGGGNVYVQVTVEGSVRAARDLALEIRDELVKVQRQTGNPAIPFPA